MRTMIAFAELLERLVFTPSRNAKIALLRRYFATQPDPDRGVGLAAHHRRAVVHRRQAGADPRACRDAHRSGAVRAGRTIMSAIWPRRSR